MPSLAPIEIDLATLTALTGTSATAALLHATREAGHPSAKTSYGYVFQLLLDNDPTVGELAEILGVSQQAASKTISELERLGYVSRTVDGSDSRIRRLSLTESGRAVVEAGRKARRTLEEQLRARVGEEALAAAKVVLVELLTLSGGLEAVARRRAPLPE